MTSDGEREVGRLVAAYVAHHPSRRDLRRCAGCGVPFIYCRMRHRVVARLIELDAVDALLPGRQRAAR